MVKKTSQAAVGEGGEGAAPRVMLGCQVELCPHGVRFVVLVSTAQTRWMQKALGKMAQVAHCSTCASVRGSGDGGKAWGGGREGGRSRPGRFTSRPLCCPTPIPPQYSDTLIWALGGMLARRATFI